LGCSEYVWGNDLIQEPLKFAIRKVDTVECLEFLAEIQFERCAVLNVRAVFILQALKFLNELFFILAFECSHKT